jgi:hypothetical protein
MGLGHDIQRIDLLTFTDGNATRYRQQTFAPDGS